MDDLDLPRWVLGLVASLRGWPVTAWLALGIGMLTVWLGALAVAHRRLRRRFEDIRQVLAQQWQDHLGAQGALQELIDQKCAERQDRLEEQLATLTEQQEQLSLRDPATAPYALAIRHAERGAGVEELMATYDLGLAEAELIVALQAGAAGRSETERP